MADISALLRAARELNGAGRFAEALETARRALRGAPGDPDAKRLASRLLARYPAAGGPEWRDDIARLLDDPAIDPMTVAPAGWHLTFARQGSLGAHDGDWAATARSMEADAFALALLDQAYVTRLDAERLLTGLRRWLLLSGAWPEFPRLVAALAAQSAQNGGAWLFEADEREKIDEDPGAAIAAAYRPAAPPSAGKPLADPVADAVADQYRRWPYPAWKRVTVPPATTIPVEIEAVDEGRPSGLPVTAEMLVAGCGTGREAAIAAFRYPDARITAIDVSETSIAYAADRCREGPPARIDFRAMDLNRVGELGKSFHFIACSGVLHHLSDPEAGWAALVSALRPGGAMRIMVYSEPARAGIRAAQASLADLRGRPADGDLLREARRRLIAAPPALLEGSIDFYTLPGIYDMLLHPQEDSFDVPRIGRALDSLGLELLAFDLPSPGLRARYRRDHPGDPAMRDLEAWAALERREPLLFRSMHKFWCRKPAR
ncbi:MAG: class I SAM-dependent methyltransferase [Allosphingosinicella sp.]